MGHSKQKEQTCVCYQIHIPLGECGFKPITGHPWHLSHSTELLTCLCVDCAHGHSLSRSVLPPQRRVEGPDTSKQKTPKKCEGRIIHFHRLGDIKHLRGDAVLSTACCVHRYHWSLVLLAQFCSKHYNACIFILAAVVLKWFLHPTWLCLLVQIEPSAPMLLY